MKQNEFNLQRLSSYLRRDWAENGMLQILYFCLIYAALTLLFFLSDLSKTQSAVHAISEVAHGSETRNNSYLTIMDLASEGIDASWKFITFTSVAAFCIFLSFTGSTFCQSSKRRRTFIAELTTPASTAEKFAVRWFRTTFVATLLFWLAAVLADFSRIGLIRLFFPGTAFSFPVHWGEVTGSGFWTMMLSACSLHAMFVLGSTYWRKKPFPKTLIFLMLLGLLSIALLFCNIHFFIGNSFHYNSALTQWVQHGAVAFHAFCLLFGYTVSYIRMRHASLVVSWKDGTTLALVLVLLLGIGLCIGLPHFIASHSPLN